MLPSIADPRWRQVASGAIKPQFEFLAVKILLGRIGMDLARDSSPRALDKAAEELRALLEKNAALPTAQRDIAKIFGGTR
jgi:hypothetical protein